MRKICIINQKGGVGKTTTAVSLGAGLARLGKRVLLVDLDPQGNITSCLHSESHKDMYSLLVENAEVKECVTHMGSNLDLISSRENLVRAEMILVGEANRETVLRRKLSKIKGYDYVVVDCPPSLGLLSQNGMLFADDALIPVSTDVLGYDGLQKQIRALQTMNEVFDHGIIVSYIVPTMYDPRNKICKEIFSKMQNEYYELVTEPIRVNSKLKEAPKSGRSIFEYDKYSRGAEDYWKLVRTVLAGEEKFLEVSSIAKKEAKVLV